jgi:aerobic C4-dicarboxylate transport protein
MLIGPIVFCTIVLGVGQHKNLKHAGSIGIKSIIYFEAVTTFALIIGMLLAYWFEPGVGLTTASNVTLPTAATLPLKTTTIYQDLLNIAPESLLAPFVEGDLLHIVIIAIMIGASLVLMRDQGKQIYNSIAIFNKLLFKLLHIVILMAPLAVFGSMAFMVSKFGLHTLINLGELIMLVFASCILFIVVILGLICRMVGVKIFEVLSLIKEEIFLTLGTSSSEIVLPQLMEKLTKKGCDPETVALVLPTGYSFNMDGVSIYLGIVVVFIAQAYGINLSFYDALFLLGYMLFISKGAAGVTGSGFIILAAVVTATKILPVESLPLLLSIDRLMSVARSLTNMIGNVVATVVIDKLTYKKQ